MPDSGPFGNHFHVLSGWLRTYPSRPAVALCRGTPAKANALHPAMDNSLQPSVLQQATPPGTGTQGGCNRPGLEALAGRSRTPLLADGRLDLDDSGYDVIHVLMVPQQQVLREPHRTLAQILGHWTGW